MFDPQIHHRRSIRLKGFDYASPGKYFITICCNHRTCLFGSVVGDRMILNDAGRMIDRWWQKIPDKFPDMALDTYQIMPNHFHAIIINTGMVDARLRVDPSPPDKVGADPCVRPDTVGADPCVRPDKVGADPCVRPDTWASDQCNDLSPTRRMDDNDAGRTHGSAPTGPDDALVVGREPDLGCLAEHDGSPLYRVVQWFKTMTTNEYIRGVKSLLWPPFHKKLWQRDYFERIIRDERAYRNIANYILNNPRNWNKDSFFRG